MGRGDKRTKRGKISMGTFGKARLARRTAKNGANKPSGSKQA
jgi:ribosomal small subunit protein bTHX